MSHRNNDHDRAALSEQVKENPVPCTPRCNFSFFNRSKYKYKWKIILLRILGILQLEFKPFFQRLLLNINKPL